MELDKDKLIEILGDFEQDSNMHPANPFDPTTGPLLDAEMITLVNAYVYGNAVPETAKWVNRDEQREYDLYSGQSADAAFAQAGFLQGLAAGAEYVLRTLQTMPATPWEVE